MQLVWFLFSKFSIWKINLLLFFFFRFHRKTLSNGVNQSNNARYANSRRRSFFWVNHIRTNNSNYEQVSINNRFPIHHSSFSSLYWPYKFWQHRNYQQQQQQPSPLQPPPQSKSSIDLNDNTCERATSPVRFVTPHKQSSTVLNRSNMETRSSLSSRMLTPIPPTPTPLPSRRNHRISTSRSTITSFDGRSVRGKTPLI